VTFREFCEEIADGVLSCVPAAKCRLPAGPSEAGFVSLGAAKATISREKAGWTVAFSGPGTTAPHPLTGKSMDEATAGKVAGSIAGFLI
jgi:hypothetical protein